ncbi:YHYH domain-containing protein [Roseateles sp. MS654]|uniref:YHYH domain-containing protein n=1 Tax=Roseateles sp. MS654 TaxID=3412685 RepID=UPI003C2C8B56
MGRRGGLIAAVAVMSALLWSSAMAHGGGLNADGCHTNRKTGDYHCHRAPARAEPKRAAAEAASPEPAASTPVQSPARPTCYTGPRGGTYTITKSGKKNYGGC